MNSNSNYYDNTLHAVVEGACSEQEEVLMKDLRNNMHHFAPENPIVADGAMHDDVACINGELQPVFYCAVIEASRSSGPKITSVFGSKTERYRYLSSEEGAAETE